MAIAASDDSSRVAVSSPSSGTVRVFSLTDGGYLETQVLRGDGGFGSSLALSGDGKVLVVSARTAFPLTAWVYEEQDAGFQPQLAVHPALTPELSAATSVEFQVPVAVSGDGTAAAIGFPQDGSVVVVRRAQAEWAITEAALPPVAAASSSCPGVVTSNVSARWASCSTRSAGSPHG
jgi:WD40 repeat protein